MSVTENVRQALKGITFEVTDREAVSQLLALLPEDARSTEVRGIIVQLVAAQKSWLHYDQTYEQCCAAIREIEVDPEDERGANLSSYESDVDRAADGRLQAVVSISSLLDQLAVALGEEEPQADRVQLAVSPYTETMNGGYNTPAPPGCVLPAVLVASLFITILLLAMLH